MSQRKPRKKVRNKASSRTARHRPATPRTPEEYENYLQWQRHKEELEAERREAARKRRAKLRRALSRYFGDAGLTGRIHIDTLFAEGYEGLSGADFASLLMTCSEATPRHS